MKQDYPNRLAYQMIAEVKELAQKAVDGSITERSRTSQLGQIVAKYDNPANVDKISKVNNQIEDVKLQLNENLTQAVKNQGDLETMEMNSNKMKDGAAAWQ